jgi:alkanesulfonate monooxygenase SsuD/methylene tetrahydromethanopterin reductase-like flavin-dependent oxidoreductase (luciferase family)
VFRVPRSVWIDQIRGQAQASDPGATRAVAADAVATDTDLDDPVPVIRLLNRQMAGHVLDPVEVYEALEPMESVIIGDVDLCRRKLARYAALGTDRLMCLMQFGPLSHASVLQSLRIAGEELLPEFSA